MTTKLAGGLISARIALTMEAGSALTFNDPVKITGTYLCDKCDATHKAIGRVVVPNVVRGSGSTVGQFPVAQVPGDVSVEVSGHAVTPVVAGAGGVTAGDPIKISATGTYVTGLITDVSFVGFSLVTAIATATFDLLWV